MLMVTQKVPVKNILKHFLDQGKAIRMDVPPEMGSSMMLRSQGLDWLDNEEKNKEIQTPKNPFSDAQI